MGKISSEGDSISWLQLYLLFFWSQADISFEAENEFLRAREMSQGVVNSLCRQMQLVDAHAMTAAIHEQRSHMHSRIGCDNLPLSLADDVHLGMILLSEKCSDRDV